MSTLDRSPSTDPSVTPAESRRPRPWSIAAAVAIGIAAVLTGASPTRAEDHDISIVDLGYDPSDITVAVGDPVTWTNTGVRSHTVTSDEGTELASEGLASGEAYGHVFDTPGTFAYHCEIHPTDMQATITVVAAAPTPTSLESPTPTPPSGTLPPDFSPFPSTGPLDSPSPAASPAAAATPAPSPADPGTGLIGDSILQIVVILGVAILIGAGIAYLLARGRPTRPSGGA